MNKDFSTLTLQEAIDWTLKNCSHNDVRKRLRSRAVAYQLLNEIVRLRQQLAEI